ncbi:hypothetical protein KIPB_004109 [Kipferlia bialata]|uniref:Uncharacterized protein n=1 Tax=Kipferlia bialata TaxID=797122 RepID=A0A9K3GHI6_9EUKA|nr:hypothetical protein KIPB_004109 [Kipferlia bialata]|eukprot:g4109.t1
MGKRRGRKRERESESDKYLTVKEWEEMWAPVQELISHTFAFAYCKAREEGIDLGPIPEDLSPKWRQACENGIDWNTYKPPACVLEETDESVVEKTEQMVKNRYRNAMDSFEETYGYPMPVETDAQGYPLSYTAVDEYLATTIDPNQT